MAPSYAVRSPDYSSVRGRAAKHIVQHTIDELEPLVTGPGIPVGAPKRQLPVPREPPPASSAPICIVGAGCAGLYAAMILDSLGLEYEILEGSDRIGGRLYTYRFNGEAGRLAPINDPARYDYVDIGAMRFPNIKFMERVFDLFDELEMKQDGLLIEYKYSADHTFQMYNGIRHNDADPQSTDVFRVSESSGGAVHDTYVAQGVDNIAAEIFGPYAEAFKTLPFEKAWKILAEQDPLSTRGYLLQRGYPEPVVEWLETFESATGLYNNAFVESTMDAMDFGSSSATRGVSVIDVTEISAMKADASERDDEIKWPWVCIDGGADHISERMAARVKSKPQLGKRVVAIASTPNGEMSVRYESGAGPQSKTYSQVICTVPLGCLAAIDIPRDDLSYMQRQAIRSLNYDTSTKIALKFQKRWWEDPEIMGQSRTIRGGISSCDIPIRTCVYPSYGFNATGPVPGVILASYTWAQDAQRLGGLAQGKGTVADQRLIDLTLQNLSELHGIPVAKFGPLVDHYAYDWHNDEYARGAFALFGPGQFGRTSQGNSMFASMKAPAAGGRLHIAGEATSVHHAWVLGALNSAWRAVYNALGNLEPGEVEVKRKLLRDLWGTPDEEDTTALKKLAALAQYKLL